MTLLLSNYSTRPRRSHRKWRVTFVCLFSQVLSPTNDDVLMISCWSSGDWFAWSTHSRLSKQHSYYTVTITILLLSTKPVDFEPCPAASFLLFADGAQPSRRRFMGAGLGGAAASRGAAVCRSGDFGQTDVAPCFELLRAVSKRQGLLLMASFPSRMLATRNLGLS